ncbi:MAG TPA: hypothetical protein VD994_03875 [Prosthecobacter sp.]|nr:hypothetical protein [Prosthecobacter sp.]
MSQKTDEFSRLKSVQVVVEERKVALQVTPDTWRTHVFTGLETIPERLRGSFSETGGGHDLNLLELVENSYKAGRVETRIEAPYRTNGDSKSPTVLRSVVVTMQFRSQAARPARAPWTPRAAAGVAMPMLSDGQWSTPEVHRAEAEVRSRFSKVSETVIKLAVRLAKLEVRPRQGTRKLVQRAVEVMERSSA